MTKKKSTQIQTKTQSLIDEYESNRDKIVVLSRQIGDLKHQMVELLLKDEAIFNLIREVHDNEVNK